MFILIFNSLGEWAKAMLSLHIYGAKKVVLKCKVIAPVCYLFQEAVLNDWQK